MDKLTQAELHALIVCIETVEAQYGDGKPIDLNYWKESEHVPSGVLKEKLQRMRDARAQAR